VTKKLPVIINKTRWGAGALSLLFVLVFAAPAGAAGTSSSSAISQEYQTNSKDITSGELLSLSASGSAIVEAANSTNASRLIGITSNKSLVELSGKNVSNVEVVVSGTAEALVSDINGPVKVGDKITASPVSGVGMKAGSSSETVGIAQADLSSVQTVSKSVDGTNGKKVDIKIGLLPVAVSVAYYSIGASTGTASSFVPPFLQTIANKLTGKQVSPLRVLVSTALLVMGFFAAAFMLSVAIRSGIISIGRNPLAETALRKGLVDVIIAAMGVLVITAVIVYGIMLY
jgi:hypothetical protein